MIGQKRLQLLSALTPIRLRSASTSQSEIGQRRCRGHMTTAQRLKKKAREEYLFTFLEGRHQIDYWQK